MPDDPNAQPIADVAAADLVADGLGPVPERVSPFVPLRQPVFRAVWFASLASNFGGLVQAVGASWMMTSIAASPDMVALVQASTTLPVMLFSLAAGAISDNYDRRSIMLTAQGFMLTVSVMLALSAWFGLITPWLLLTFTFLIGCGTALNNPAWQSSVGDMVPRRDVPAAVTLNSVAFNIARSVGPAIGGAIVAAAGAVAAFTINAFSYIALIVVLARWQPPRVERLLPRETLWIAMSAGVRYIAMSPNIRSVILRSFAFGFGGIVVLALLPLIARDLVHGGPLTFGVLLGAFGAGAVAGAFMSARLRRMLSTEALVRLTFAGYAAAAAIIALSTSMWLTMPALCVAGASWVLTLSTFNATVQLSAPRWVVGRALALYQMAAFGGMATGSWAWGQATLHLGPEKALLISAIALLVGAAIGLRYKLPPLEELNLDPLSSWREPKVAVDIEPRSGPVIVTIEYIIREEDVVAFLNAMAERRRIRRRDGARHWTLLRDLTDPMLWMERYDSPTWVEYVRQNQRVTQADAEIGERVRALHSGPNPPVVHRMIERQTGSLPSVQAAAAGTLSDPLVDPLRAP
ncbi:Predicted arabinose efflux permease, MFS family [Bosea lathyri]|uniref:Predicted arabinose efflux permease, MFS family n=1 Tax=Bosea lathyri TaxID=1036778 RepID=A0A1H6D2C5_9HYPH|nr:MFS transporter [Bosea lathyri]SEG79430.1 Predicted arabinose efflux permease, MFS family [Bosea lathyri]